jgi:hypothetical protein
MKTQQRVQTTCKEASYMNQVHLYDNGDYTSPYNTSVLTLLFTRPYKDWWIVTTLCLIWCLIGPKLVITPFVPHDVQNNNIKPRIVVKHQSLEKTFKIVFS